MHIKKIVLTATALAFLFSGVSVSAQTVSECALLSKNLRVGMSGSDVKVLQQILNKNAATRIAASGSGAPGAETMYFGAKTKVAVIKFQQLYAKEVLTPAGLTVGSGFVGGFSRAKLKSLCVAKPASTTTSTTPTPLVRPVTVVPPPAALSVPVAQRLTPHTPPATFAIPASRSVTPSPAVLAAPVVEDTGLPTISFPSVYTLSPGGEVTVYGTGFSKTANTLHIGTLTFERTVDITGGLTVTIPANADLGKFDLWFSNAKGASNKKFLIIKKEGGISPKITGFSPRSGLLGTVVTVTGEGFTPQGNDIYLGNQVISGVNSPDGKTLTFTIEAKDIPEATNGLDDPTMDLEIPMWFYIVNTNGFSGNGVFTIKV